MRTTIAVYLLLAAVATARAADDLEQNSFAVLQGAMARGALTSHALTAMYLQRIEHLDRKGPRLNSVIAVNPGALDAARALDVERRAGKVRSPLHGLPILVKDNIETADPLATTAGSFALAENVTRRDAPLAGKLREAGVVMLGKANLTEWANMRSTKSINGWSAVGGLVRNPHALDRSPCGSSSGSAVAVAAGLAAGAVGTETDGSITCPASMVGVVGLKPTVGLVSRSRIVPISSSQDTPGPMTRTVADAAGLLTIIAGSDPTDPATRDADRHREDYGAALNKHALAGVRLGILRGAAGLSPGNDAAFERALGVLRTAGAVLVEVKMPDLRLMEEAEEMVFNAEFKAGINAYLATTPPVVKTRNLTDLIAFNRNDPRELILFGQDVFEDALAAPGLEDSAYLSARDTAQRLARQEGIDRLLRDAEVEALVSAGPAPAAVVDPIYPRRSMGSPSALPAVAGYPHLTVPMGLVMGLPVGLSFIGPAWSEARLLSFGYAFEQRFPTRSPPRFAHSIDHDSALAAALDPPPTQPP